MIRPIPQPEHPKGHCWVCGCTTKPTLSLCPECRLDGEDFGIDWLDDEEDE